MSSPKPLTFAPPAPCVMSPGTLFRPLLSAQDSFTGSQTNTPNILFDVGAYSLERFNDAVKSQNSLRPQFISSLRPPMQYCQQTMFYPRAPYPMPYQYGGFPFPG